MDLPTEHLKDALTSIAAWRLDAQAPCRCPVCGALGLTIIDRSARPHAEWYSLCCASCSLDATVHIPLAGGPEM